MTGTGVFVQFVCVLFLTWEIIGSQASFGDKKHRHNSHAHVTKLSSWQLHPLTDHIFEITMSKCPTLSKDIVQNLKTVARDYYAAMDAQLTVSLDFFALYSYLVNCIYHGNRKATKDPTTVYPAEYNFLNSTKDMVEKASRQSDSDEFKKSPDKKSTLNLVHSKKIKSIQEISLDFLELIVEVACIVENECPPRMFGGKTSFLVPLLGKAAYDLLDTFSNDVFAKIEEFISNNSEFVNQIKECFKQSNGKV